MTHGALHGLGGPLVPAKVGGGAAAQSLSPSLTAQTSLPVTVLVMQWHMMVLPRYISLAVFVIPLTSLYSFHSPMHSLALPHHIALPVSHSPSPELSKGGPLSIFPGNFTAIEHGRAGGGRGPPCENVGITAH